MELLRTLQRHAVLADPTSFTGRVWRVEYLPGADEHALHGVSMSYEPQARSFWHVHDEEQVIIAVSGVGVVCWQGLDAPELLHPGDWWHVTPGIPHWHGATPDVPFSHLAITAGGGTRWLGEVSEAEYSVRPRGRTADAS
jgi:quercetin dioxygenase-like cupin family protein